MKDQVAFANKKYQRKFNDVRDVYFERFENILKGYDDEVAYINNPKNKMAKSNLDFTRAIAVDHLVMEIMSLIAERMEGLRPKGRNAKHYTKWMRKGTCPGCGVGCGSDHRPDCWARKELLRQI